MLYLYSSSRRTVDRFWNYIPRRCKSKKEHWAKLARKKTPMDKALEHFDDFYKKVFGPQWSSVRVALLSPNKYCALVNNFSDSSGTISYLKNRGALDLRMLFENVQQEESQLNDRNKNQFVNNNNSIKLECTMKRIAATSQMQEFNEIYPPEAESSVQRSGITRKNSSNEELSPEKQFQSTASLEMSKVHAQIEEHRMIDASVGLNASSLYEFVPASKLKGLEDFVPESDHYRYYSVDVEFPVTKKQELKLEYPEHLNVYMYERGNVTSFERPRRGPTGVLDYYLMDSGSILPVLALEIQPGDKVLDMCAGPGGKSLAILQTLKIGCLVCNDVKLSRMKRIESVFHQYVYDLPKWSNIVSITNNDGRSIPEENKFNKILVDVPCTTDRHSLQEEDNNIFSVARLKERLRLPELQSDLLKSALKLVVPGGSVVYSTCSLSPIQNDGVVHMALRKIWEETNIEVEVRDLSPALEVMEPVFKFGDDIGLKYGHLVLPFLPSNCGPLYFCKIVRTK